MKYSRSSVFSLIHFSLGRVTLHQTLWPRVKLTCILTDMIMGMVMGTAMDTGMGTDTGMDTDMGMDMGMDKGIQKTDFPGARFER